MTDVSFRGAKERAFWRGVSFLGEKDATAAPWTLDGRRITDLVTPAGLHVRGTAVVHVGWKNLETLAFKLLRGAYFAHAGKSLPREAKPVAHSFEDDPREMIAGMLRVPGCVTRRGFPFEYALAIGNERAHVAAAFFVLWGQHVLWAHAIGPEADVKAG